MLWFEGASLAVMCTISSVDYEWMWLPITLLNLCLSWTTFCDSFNSSFSFLSISSYLLTFSIFSMRFFCSNSTLSNFSANSLFFWVSLSSASLSCLFYWEVKLCSVLSKVPRAPPPYKLSPRWMPPLLLFLWEVSSSFSMIVESSCCSFKKWSLLFLLKNFWVSFLICS